jgi:hypothetical protein
LGHARLLFCNVQRKIEADGSSMQVAWLFVHGPVADTSGFFVAVHDAVWRSPEGNLLEITPTPSALTDNGNLLFLPDDQAALERPAGFEIGQPVLPAFQESSGEGAARAANGVA